LKSKEERRKRELKLKRQREKKGKTNLPYTEEGHRGENSYYALKCWIRSCFFRGHGMKEKEKVLHIWGEVELGTYVPPLAESLLKNGQRSGGAIYKKGKGGSNEALSLP